jgi:hypothetical protein
MERIAGINCVKLVARKAPGGGEIIWWIAPEYGYLVLPTDEVKYFKPAKGLRANQHVVIRKRVSGLKRFGDGLYLPTKAEQVTAWVNPDGSVTRLLARWRFTLTDIAVNGPVDAGLFGLSDPNAPEQRTGPARKRSLGCGYSALLDFCSLMNRRVDDEEQEELARFFPEGQETFFADLAAHLVLWLISSMTYFIWIRQLLPTGSAGRVALAGPNRLFCGSMARTRVAEVARHNE